MLNTDMPKISVIMCAYNAEKYIAKAIESVLGQSFKDIELIIVNDGSCDSTLAICSDYAMRDKRVRLLDVSNGGPAKARNIAINIAKGDFLTFCDADDYIDLDAYKVMYNSAVQDGSDMVVCGYYNDIYKNEKLVSSSPQVTKNAVIKNKQELFDMFIELKSRFVFDSTCNKLFKRSVVAQNDVLMPEGEIFEDTSFVLKFLIFSCKVTVLDKCFYHYIRRESGSLTKGFNPNKISNFKRLYLELWSFVAEASEDVKNYCSTYYLRTIYSCLSEFVGTKGFKEQVRAQIVDDTFKYSSQNAYKKGLSNKLTVWVSKTKCVFINAMYCKILRFMKYKARRLFVKIK